MIRWKIQKKTTNKASETLIKELESLSHEDLHKFFLFVYKLNHQHANMIESEQFEDFLAAFDANPFKLNEDRKFRKQLIDTVMQYAHDHMSLLTAAVLIKKRFTIEELAQNYYASVDLFDGTWY